MQSLSTAICLAYNTKKSDRLKIVLASSNDQKYPRYPLVFKINVTLARPLRMAFLYSLMEILVES